MVDNTFIHYLISSGYAGIKIDKEGNFQLDLTSVGFLVWTIFGYLLVGLFLYCRLQHPTDGIIEIIVDVMAASATTLNPVIAISLWRVGKSSYFTATGFSWVRIILYLVVASLVLFPCAFLNLQRFGAETFADVVLVVLIVADYVGKVVFFEFLYIIIMGFNNEWKSIKYQSIIQDEDIEIIKEKYETMKSGLQLPMLIFFTSLQICFILSISLAITMPKYCVLTSLCLGMLIIIGTLVYAMENVYGMLSEFGLKADICVLQAVSYRQMARLQKALDRLEGSGKANGWGFFEVDRSTLTAMLSTTLTYTIIMYQMAPTQ